MSRFNGFFDNFSSALGNPKGNLGDYAHASALYVRNNLRLAPKVKFLYHVTFDINQNALSQLGNGGQLLDKREVNLLVEQAQLPSYNFDTSVLNMYNRKKIVQTKINYEPVEMIFHDDNAGLTTLLWELYFRYYYADPNYARNDFFGRPDTSVPAAFANDTVDHYKSETQQNYRYGLDKTRFTNNPFFNSITINQLHSGDADAKYTSITLVNPMIAQFMHDNVAQGESAFSKNTMRIEYESVLYGRGDTATDSPAGFADPSHYDVTPSPLSIEGGGVANLFGAGGVVSGFANAFSDIGSGNFNLGSALNLFNTVRNAQDLSKSSVGNELFSIQQAVVDQIVLAGINGLFPNSNTSNNNVTNTQQVITNSSSNQSKSDLKKYLTGNQQALDDYTFNTIFKDEAYSQGFSGNINDLKSDYDALPRSTKDQLNDITLGGF